MGESECGEADVMKNLSQTTSLTLRLLSLPEKLWAVKLQELKLMASARKKVCDWGCT